MYPTSFKRPLQIHLCAVLLFVVGPKLPRRRNDDEMLTSNHGRSAGSNPCQGKLFSVLCFLFVILGQFYEEDVFNIPQMLFNLRWEGVLTNGRRLRQRSTSAPVHYSTSLQSYGK